MRLIASLAMILAFASKSFAFGIVTRTATRDTLSLPFQALDSLGNAVDLTTGDSVYITVFSPGGTIVFKDSMAFNDASIASYDWEDFSGGEQYVYSERVAVLDGSSNSDGIFSYVLVVDDNSSADLTTSYFGTFQIVNSTLDNALDSSGIAATNSSRALDSLALVIDSLYAVLDSLQNQDDWVGNVRYSGSDSVLALRGVRLIGTSNGDTALVLNGNGAGPAIFARGGSGANGVELVGGTAGTFPGTGNGLSIISSVGAAAYFDGYWDGAVFKAGAAGGDGVTMVGGTYTGTSGYGLHVEGLARAVGLIGHGSGNPAFLVSSDSSAAMQLSGVADSDLVAAIIGDLHGSAVPSDTNSSGELLARVSDSTAFQGAASSPSVIADAVWDESQSGHSSAGSFGKYLDAEISGVGSGSGLYSYQFVAYDSSLDQVVHGAAIAVRNLAQTGLIATGLTRSSGSVGFNLDADSFVVVTTAPGYLFESFDTVVVTGSGTDTITGYSFDPGSPGSPDLCRVYGWIVDLQGLPQENVTVSAGLPYGVVRSGGRVVSPRNVTGITDSTGYFYLDLIPSDSLVGDVTTYEISASRTDGSILRKRIEVPATATWQFSW